MTVIHHELPGVFSRRDPTSPAPVVFDIPRSGREYPADFDATASFSDLHSSVSRHLERLYDGAPEHGATWLYARFPNTYIDANRHERDIDPAMLDGDWSEPLAPSEKSRAGIGLIPMVVRGSRPLYAHGKLAAEQVRQRINSYYRPYHDELARILKGLHRQHGVAYHLSCHSMGSRIPAPAPNAGQLRSDFDLGDRRGTTADQAFTEFVRQTLAGMGYSVTLNTHFIGAECVRRHGAPTQGVHSLQIEMRRDLYMDEANGAVNIGFERVRSHMSELAAAVVNYARDASKHG